MSNILAQKKEIKRAGKAKEEDEKREREEKERLDAEAQERAVKEFEMVQAGFDVRNGAGKGGMNGRTVEGAGSSGGPVLKQGEKRKFELDDDELARIAQEDRAKARKALDDEDKAGKPKLPSFWTPSVVPVSNANDVLHEVKKKAKTAPICPASQEGKPHNYSLHTLVGINFTEEEEEGKDKRTPQRSCPSCKKGLSNASKATMAKPCGHVLCKNCVTQFMKPTHDPHHPGSDILRCYVCDADLTDRGKAKKDGGKGDKEKEKIRPGLVELRSEGTGFSAGGSNQVKKSGVAFQC